MKAANKEKLKLTKGHIDEGCTLSELSKKYDINIFAVIHSDQGWQSNALVPKSYKEK